MRSILPERQARWVLGVAVATWAGVLAVGNPLTVAMMIALGGVIFAVTARSQPVLAATIAGFALLGMASGAVVAHRVAAVASVELPAGLKVVTLRVSEDASAASFGLAVGVITAVDGAPWTGPRVGIASLPTNRTVGSTLTAEARVVPGVRRIRDELVAGVVHIRSVLSADETPNPIVSAGNIVRRTVAERYDGNDPSDGLLSGFLTGDTDRMSASDLESLRLAGLSHFVAVSGSNVALFLGIWWLITAPLSIRRRMRVVIGGVGLLLFAVITRWEPSVVRACVMAATVLASGSLGIPIDPWVALGVAVTALLLASGQLAFSVGFQLSVLATAGVLVGLSFARGREPRWLFVPLFSTVGAQLAVAPLLLAVFDSIPLLAPVTNLMAAPVIAVSTIVGALGVVVPIAADLARIGAGTVQTIADMASGGPQLGVLGFAIACVFVCALSVRVIRAPAAAIGAVALVAMVPWTHPWPDTPGLTVLDVGQGDAILIQSPDRQSLLMDGGADPRILDRALRRHGVRWVDTVVVSHADDDHAGGLAELIEGGRVGRLVVSAFAEPQELVALAAPAGVRIVRVGAGDRLDVGAIRIEVLSPSRRYESDNNGSVVLLVSSAVSVLLPGDIEAVAQRDLPHVDVDVMVVPHHGSGTTDVGWLADIVGEVAILSYGPNRYGHPHEDIVAALEAEGVQVLRTPDGDVTVSLASATTHVTQGR